MPCRRTIRNIPKRGGPACAQLTNPLGNKQGMTLLSPKRTIVTLFTDIDSMSSNNLTSVRWDDDAALSGRFPYGLLSGNGIVTDYHISLNAAPSAFVSEEATAAFIRTS